MARMQIIASIIVIVVGSLFVGCDGRKPTPDEVKTQEPIPISHPSWISKEYVTGHFDPSKHDDFEIIDRKYADREGLLLRKGTYAAFRQMYDAAQKAGHTLIIKSATRNFDYQKGIWERKWTGKTLLEGGINGAEIENPITRAKKILLYSSMPGTSRHHWGTDIDFNSFNNDYFKKGKGAKLYEWMQYNASTFGFCQPYTTKNDGRNGYEEECWHWSYMPISKPLTEYSREYLKNEMIEGFSGSATAVEVDMVHNYVLGINSSCL
ncbi:MAG: D-alanyl-D-alanine carboxypeptidase [Saprospiraceae bacterium]|jgi:D-alanyl-D-alanine carboxypeptidase